MNNVAVCAGNIVIYWSAIVICLGTAAAFALGMSLYISHGGKRAEMWVFFPFAVLFSVVFSRVIHWYCHEEQYIGLVGALTDFSGGNYCLSGVLFGVIVAALILKALFKINTMKLFDCVAPGLVLGFAIFRLSALFNSSCRGTIVVTNPTFQHLPLASRIVNASGGTEYRLATFFIEFILFIAVLFILLGFFFNRRRVPMKGGCRRDGNVAMMFLLFVGAAELLTDSTRYDSSFLHLNGFVSVVQIISAVSILIVLVYYSRFAVRADGRRLHHWIKWGLYFVSLAGVGVSEYMVQRHGDWYLACYAAMTAFIVLMCVTVYKMYLAACED